MIRGRGLIRFRSAVFEDSVDSTVLGGLGTRLELVAFEFAAEPIDGKPCAGLDATAVAVEQEDWGFLLGLELIMVVGEE